MKRTWGWILLGASIAGFGACAEASAPSGSSGPPAPTNVTAIPGPFLNEITILWHPVPGAADYYVYWGTTPGVTPRNGTRVVNAGPGPLFTHNGLTANTAYYYVVTSVDATNVEGPPSTVTQATASDNIGLRFITPKDLDVLSQGQLNVLAGVISRFQMGHVTAAVGDRSVALTLLSSAGNEARWSGTVPLDGLSLGPLTLTIAATDVFSTVVTASIEFIHSTLPTLTITAPESLSLARPTIRVAASCANENLNACASVTVGVAGGPVLATGHPGIDQILSLAAYEGKSVTLVFYGTDSLGQVSMTGSRRVFVESSAQLTEVASVNGPIFDVQPDRILFLNQLTGGNALTIRDRLSGQDLVIYDQPGHVPVGGYLTPVGAMFREAAPDFPPNLPMMVHEWSLGGLSDLGASLFLVVKGRYAIYMTTAGLIRRDVVADVTTIVSAGGYGDVAENGDVAYFTVDGTSHVYLFKNGATALLSTGIGGTFLSVLTDGVNVVSSFPTSGPVEIALYDMTGKHVLSEEGSLSLSQNYRLANGWVAFPSGLDVFSRSPAGQVLQVSKFTSGSVLSALGPNGEVAFTNGSRRYLAVPDYSTPPREIGSALGTAFFQNGGLFVIIGRSLFQVNP